ncbi:MAG: hypothetical protein HOP29_18645 [Phycisphaerales bacterium]|nr:hypothetical protein [Phycisphaerales bacterium]
MLSHRSSLLTTSIREFRGNGRTRYMMRDRIINPGQPNDLMPNYDTGTWTSYDGETPTKDWTLTWTTDPAPAHYVGSNVVRYHLGLAQFTPGATTGEFDVKYFHADHLGTTRAMTDEGQTGPPAMRGASVCVGDWSATMNLAARLIRGNRTPRGVIFRTSIV